MKPNRQAVFDMFHGHCAYCGCEITIKSFQVDHVHAQARGGKNEDKNYMPACRSCNATKATYTIDEFRERLIGDVDRLRRDSAKFRILERFMLLETGVAYIDHITDYREFKFYFETVEKETKIERINNADSFYEMDKI